MPELPEIEHLKRTLAPLIIGATIRSVTLNRADIVECGGGRPARPADLLRGGRIARLHRHGKQLAIETADGRALCIHLGMSGQLFCAAGRPALARSTHVHCMWNLRGRGGDSVRLLFRDPRRFGGVWAFGSMQQLRADRWSDLGPDALAVDARTMAGRLATTRRAIKAALLDQSVIAGLGNIYVDESLFRAGIHPLTPTPRLTFDRVDRLATAINEILTEAIRSGGSTLRDYIDAQGRAGSFRFRHLVYGRGGEPCVRCGHQLIVASIAQRTTVYCARCQHPREARSKDSTKTIHRLHTSVPPEREHGNQYVRRT